MIYLIIALAFLFTSLLILSYALNKSYLIVYDNNRYILVLYSMLESIDESREREIREYVDIRLITLFLFSLYLLNKKYKQVFTKYFLKNKKEIIYF